MVAVVDFEVDIVVDIEETEVDFELDNFDILKIE